MLLAIRGTAPKLAALRQGASSATHGCGARLAPRRLGEAKSTATSNKQQATSNKQQATSDKRQATSRISSSNNRKSPRKNRNNATRVPPVERWRDRKS
ncbi:hypothetical protein EIQ19_13285 [Xanthomonas campestris pv. campestris]